MSANYIPLNEISKSLKSIDKSLKRLVDILDREHRQQQFASYLGEEARAYGRDESTEEHSDL